LGASGTVAAPPQSQAVAATENRAGPTVAAKPAANSSALASSPPPLATYLSSTELATSQGTQNP
jgi:hypothetical protein